MEPLKEAAEAWLQRVRSPILGYSLLASLAINWKAIWALIFADIDVFSKFLYFDLRTSPCTLIILPILIGFFSAVLTPWVGFIGSYLVQRPFRLQVELQEKARHQSVIRKIMREAEEEAVRENALIERAKRDARAGEVDPKAAETLKRAREEAESSQGGNQLNLSSFDSSLVVFMGAQASALVPEKMDLAMARVAFEPVLPNATPQRIKVELNAALERLRNSGLADGFAGQWSLTSKGYEEFDRLSKSP